MMPQTRATPRSGVIAAISVPVLRSRKGRKNDPCTCTGGNELWGRRRAGSSHCPSVQFDPLVNCLEKQEEQHGLND